VNLYRPPRRGPVAAIVLLTVGFLASTSIAVWEYVELQRAEERIDDLESGGGDDGGLLGELGELFEGLGEGFGEAPGENPFADQASLLECLGGSFPDLQGGEAPGGTPEQQVAAIAEEVEGIRELTFTEPVEPTFLSSEEATARVRELFLQDYGRAVADAEERVLTALGAIPRGTDLRDLRARALGQQVAGFYDPRTRELVIRQAGAELGAIDRITLSHELDHALTDQALDLPVPDEIVPGREDRDLAALAVVEGDATLVMQRYSASLSLQEQLELLDPSVIAQAETGLADVPPYLEQELLFPYEEGLRFVCRLYTEGGWEAVNAAYADPPESTAQVLFPERYAADEQPVDPRDPAGLRASWREAGVREFGAANLVWLLQAPGGDPSDALADPRAAAEAWAGGEIHLWTRGEESAVGLVLAERAGEDVLCSAASHWYAAAYPEARAAGSATASGLTLDGSDQDAVLVCAEDEVRLGIAPDLRTAGAMTR
jgi:hypothetical protein